MKTTPVTGETIQYAQPIHYHLNKTGYYCVGEACFDKDPLLKLTGTCHLGAIPVTVLHQGETGGANHTHASFSGTVLFRNEFWGQLSAADYPKINVSHALFTSL